MNYKQKTSAAIQALADLVKAHGITQVELSRKTGISQPNISWLLNGKNVPTLTTVFRCLEAINEIAGKEYGLSALESKVCCACGYNQ